jgi:hypothetical protein
MTNDTPQLISDEFPLAWTDSPPPIGMLVQAYNELRAVALKQESALVAIRGITDATGDVGGYYGTQFGKIATAAQDALNP